MYSIPQEYTPEQPYYSRKGRTYYKKHPVYPRNYTQSDFKIVKQFFEKNPKITPKELWVSSNDPTDLNQLTRFNLFSAIFYQNTDYTYQITDSLPDPVSIIIYLVVKDQGQFFFFPFPVSSDLATESLDIVVLNPTQVKYCLFSAPSNLSFYDTQTSRLPSFVFSPSTNDGTPYLVNSSTYSINVDQLNINDVFLSFPQ